MEFSPKDLYRCQTRSEIRGFGTGDCGAANAIRCWRGSIWIFARAETHCLVGESGSGKSVNSLTRGPVAQRNAAGSSGRSDWILEGIEN